jgi:hypothetical protein
MNRYGEMFVTMEQREMVLQMIPRLLIRPSRTVDAVVLDVVRVRSTLQQSGFLLVPTWSARQSFSTTIPSS